tara:strand:- start:1006 stop:1278 length:273 start_codon:yes stop_codon:yes gene_type:complete
MFKLIANYGTCSLWVMSVKDTAFAFLNGGSMQLIQVVLSVLGGVYTIVLIVNKILDGNVNREKTKLENEMLKLEIWELEDENLEDRYEEL